MTEFTKCPACKDPFLVPTRFGERTRRVFATCPNCGASVIVKPKFLYSELAP